MPAKPFRLGFFTRLVDDAPPGEIYARALRLFERAEDSATRPAGSPSTTPTRRAASRHRWSSSPPPPLARRGFAWSPGSSPCPLESPVRLAEDAAVLDTLSGGRFELGFGTGGNAVVFSIFGRDAGTTATTTTTAPSRSCATRSPGSELVARRPADVAARPSGSLATHVGGDVSRRGRDPRGRARHRPAAGAHRAPAPRRRRRWAGAAPAARRGPGPDRRRLPRAWTSTAEPPRASACRARSTSPRPAPRRWPTPRRACAATPASSAQREGIARDMSVEELLARADVHIGSPADVIASLRADPLLARRHRPDGPGAPGRPIARQDAAIARAARDRGRAGPWLGRAPARRA